MAMCTIGSGSKYPFTGRDAQDQILNGTYLPATSPIACVRRIVLSRLCLQRNRRHDARDGTEDSVLNGSNRVMSNPAWSIDLIFGPQKPTDAPGANWIQVIGGRDFLVALRLYGAELAFCDQSWKPDDIVRLG